MTADGRYVLAADDGERLCDALDNARAEVLQPGDEVLFWHPGSAATGVILGRIGSRSETTTDSLIIEARENLTLRCGEGSITIRKDGRILIKGKDLVSHAHRANRIRGGSVAIN
jgi:hypothetical protein